MRSSSLSLLPCLVALAACAAAPSARLAPTPLGLPIAPARIEAQRSDADRSPATPGVPSPFVHDPAVRALYGGGAPELASAPQPAAGADASADADAPVAAVPAPAHRHEAYELRRAREPFVPVATIFGAGLGAALSHRSHRGQGALLGAGIGLLFDLQRAAR